MMNSIILSNRTADATDVSTRCGSAGRSRRIHSTDRLGDTNHQRERRPLSQPVLICAVRAIVVCLLVAFVFQAHAQKKPDPAIAALLQKVEAAQSDTARINALVSLAEEYRYKNPKEGIKRADEAEALATKVGYAEGAAKAMLAGGWDEYQAGSLKTAGERFAKAAAALKAVGNKVGWSYAVSGIAAIQDDGDGNQKAALATMEKARTIAQESGDVQAMGRVALFLGILNRDAGNSDSAIAQLSRARDMMQAAGAVRDAGKVSRSLGTAYAMVGRYDEAVAAIQGAVKAAEALGDLGMLAQAHIAISNVHYAQKLLPETIRARQKAVEIYLKMGVKVEAGNTLVSIGGLYLDLRDFEKAAAALDTARVLFAEIGDTAGLSDAEGMLGNAAFARSRYTDGIRHIETAIRYAEAVGNKKKQAALWSTLSLPYERLGNVSARRNAAARVLKLTAEIGDRAGYLDGLRGAVGAAVTSGDYRAADSLLGIGMDSARASGKPAEIAEAHRFYAYRYTEEGDYPRAIRSGYEALPIYESLRDTSHVALTYHLLMLSYNGAKQYEQTVKLADDAAAFRMATHPVETRLLILQPLSDAYREMGQYARMQAVNRERLDILNTAGDTTSKQYAQAIEALGDAFWRQGRYDEALPLLHHGLRIREGHDDKTSPAPPLLSIGKAYMALAKDTAYTIIPDSLIPTTREAAVAKSVAYLTRALPLFRTSGERNDIQRTLQALSEAQSMSGDYKSSFANFKEHIAIRDTIVNAASTREILRREMDYTFGKQADSIRAASERQQLALQKEQALAAFRYEYDRKQTAVKSDAERSALRNEEELKRRQIEDEHRYTEAAVELRRQREAAQAKAEADKRAAIAAAELRRQKALGTAAMVGGGLLLVAAVAALFAYRQKRKAAVIIAREKGRSEDLLLNILPAEVADELKASGGAQAKLHDDVTIVFTDFVNFTGTAEQLTPQQLVQELHECFTAFDAIMERHGLEKIKTIGDAYLAVSGLPVKSARHAEYAVSAALDILDFMEQRGKRERTFGIRIGIHSGPVVAGIVGIKKFAYDIWGDTVNTAARMEQSGEPGKINISSATEALIRSQFAISYRGEMPAKGKGTMSMYFVDAPVREQALTL